MTGGCPSGYWGEKMGAWTRVAAWTWKKDIGYSILKTEPNAFVHCM